MTERQHLEGNRLTLVREDLSGLPAALPKEHLSPTIAADLLPSTFVQSDHPKIQALAASWSTLDDAPLANLRRMVDWMQTNIEKRPVLSLPDALTTLDKRMGDCNEHAVLMAALARAAGYPAQVEAGLVYQDGRFFYHAWNRIYIGRWIVDPVARCLPHPFARAPAAPAYWGRRVWRWSKNHIQMHKLFARGSAHEQLDILPLLEGRVSAGPQNALQIRVLEQLRWSKNRLF
jgi:hypothetical protein